MDSKKLWTKNFTIITLATAMGAIGNTAGSFALSFLVFNETQSTFAASLNVAISVIPGFFIPLFASPLLDRIPRKPVLVACDGVSSVIYLLAGLWLKNNEFDYIAYLLFSLILASVGSFDRLSYDSLYPKLIPEGCEEKGFTISSMLYPVIMMVMSPVAALLYKTVGVANILLGQSVFSLLATVIESNIKVEEVIKEGTKFSLKQWWGDIKETANYLKKEKGLLSMTLYSDSLNGMYSGLETLQVAFFSTATGFTMAMYSFFQVAQFIGRTLGGIFIYKKEIPKEKKYKHALTIYMIFDTMDMLLLHLSYPLMLVNRAMCGYMGIQSGTLRHAAIQKYIPESNRARINAFDNILYLVFSTISSLVIGFLGDIFPYKWVYSGATFLCIILCLLTIVRNKSDVEKIYLSEGRNNN